MARHRFVNSQQLRPVDEVPNGDCGVCVGVYQEGRLDVFVRPQGFLSIRNSSCIFGFVLMDVSTSFVPLFRSVCGLASGHQSLHSDFGVGALEGCAPPSLSEQLGGHCGVKDLSSVASGSGSPVVQGSGDHCQLGEA